MEGSGKNIALGIAGRATCHFITFARIPIARLEPMDGQRPLITETVDGIYEDLTENNVGRRDIHPLGVILTREGSTQPFKRWLVTQKPDTVLSFEGIPEESRFKVFSGNHRTAAVKRYLEAHQNDDEPPSAVMRSWLCAVYDADLADDPELPILMVAHNLVGHHSATSTRQWISGLQSCGESIEKIKSNIALTADASLAHNLCIVRTSALWESLTIYGSREFNKSLTLPIISSWAGSCAEFEILGLLLRDGVSQQEHIASFKKEKKPLTPFDIFGPVWGVNGHKQSGDYENAKKDWNGSKIRGFGSQRTFSFRTFWNKATVDKAGNEYVFGNVILVPEDLRVDPKGGKRKDMVGYVILRQARYALSCLATILFAGNFDYRYVRSSLGIPDPWVATIMETAKAGVDEKNIEQLIRYMVPRLSELVPDWKLNDLPHLAAHRLLKSNDGKEVLSEMVWPELIKGKCYMAWDEFLSHCEDQFELARNGEFWDVVTKMKNSKPEPKTGLRHKSTSAPEAYVTFDDDNDTYTEKQPAAKKKRGAKRARYQDGSSIESEVIVVPKTRRAAAKQRVSESRPGKRPLTLNLGSDADVDMVGYDGRNLGRVDQSHDMDLTLNENPDGGDDQGHTSEEFTDTLMALVDDQDDDEIAGKPQESSHPTIQVPNLLPVVRPIPAIQKPNSSSVVQRSAANQVTHSSSLIPPSRRWASAREQAISREISFVSATDHTATSPIIITQGTGAATQAISNYAGNRMVLDLPHVHVTVPRKRKRKASGMEGDQRPRAEPDEESNEYRLLRQRADASLARIEMHLGRQFEAGHGNTAVELLEALEHSLATTSFESSN